MGAEGGIEERGGGAGRRGHEEASQVSRGPSNATHPREPAASETDRARARLTGPLRARSWGPTGGLAAGRGGWCLAGVAGQTVWCSRPLGEGQTFPPSLGSTVAASQEGVWHLWGPSSPSGGLLRRAELSPRNAPVEVLILRTSEGDRVWQWGSRRSHQGERVPDGRKRRLTETVCSRTGHGTPTCAASTGGGVTDGAAGRARRARRPPPPSEPPRRGARPDAPAKSRPPRSPAPRPEVSAVVQLLLNETETTTWVQVL